MNEKIRNLIDEIRSMLDRGLETRARARLREIVDRKGVLRGDLLAFARLARRARAYGLAMRLLSPFVRGHGRNFRKPSAQEKAEYAACLTMIGAEEEALFLLKSIDPKTLPESLLFQAYALFPQWDYATAIPLLRNCLASSEIGESTKSLVRVNLAAAFVYEREYVEAQALLDEMIAAEAYLEKRSRFYFYALELSAQNAFHQRDWKKASDYLRSAQTEAKDMGTLFELFLRKWEVVFQLYQNPDPSCLKGLELVRGEAAACGQWETVRDCDRHEAIATQNRALLAQVYHGTPFPKFRERLIKDFGSPVVLKNTYRWRIGDGEGEPFVLDLFQGALSRDQSLKAGQGVHRLLCSLSSDFYRPIRVATLHARLHPGEIFNPVSSPLRVHQAVRRLRKWLKSSLVPLVVEEKDGAYRLRATYACHIVISQGSPDRSSQSITQLYAELGNHPFSAAEAAHVLKVDRRTVLRVLAPGIRQGRVKTRGGGASLRYYIVKKHDMPVARAMGE